MIWPAYFDRRLSWRFGRKVPRELAVEAPKAEEIARVLQELKVDFEYIPGKGRPATWWERTGYFLVPKQPGGKRRLLLRIAERLVALRRK